MNEQQIQRVKELVQELQKLLSSCTPTRNTETAWCDPIREHEIDKTLTIQEIEYSTCQGIKILYPYEGNSCIG